METKQLYIDGAWTDATDGQTFEVDSPPTGEALAEVAKGTEKDADRAVRAASEAQAAWERMTVFERADLLKAATAYFRRHEERIVRQITAEEGKTLAQSQDEVDYVIESSDDYAADGIRLFGEVVPSERRDAFAYTRREPYGVAVVISPWNFPLEIPAGSIYAALISGNTVVFKPPSATPLSGLEFAHAFEEAGMPDGVFNVVTGGGSTVGDALVEHPDTDLIAFTGSTEVGQSIAQKAAKRNKQCLLEMGGKDPLLVLGDADLDAAVEAVVEGTYNNAGQVCCATERVIVEAGVADDFTDRLADRVLGLRVGNPLDDPDVEMGPMISADGVQNVARMLEEAVGEGSVVEAGGGHEGLYFEPTVLSNVRTDQRIAQEELFGPVAPVIEAADFDDAVRIANDSRYGLQAAVFTDSLELAMKAADRIKAGGIFVNETNNYWERLIPFGGYKESGAGGRYGSKWHLEAMTQIKGVLINFQGK